METKKKFFIPKGYRLPLLLLACIVVGAVLGLTLGEKILWVKPIGTIFVNLCFTIAVPTVMFSIISSVARIQTVGRLGKILRTTLLIFVITGIVAGILMIAYCQVVNPGKGIENIVAIKDSEITEFSLADRIVETITVTDFPNLFSRSHVLPLIIACLLIGAVLSKMGERAEVVRNMMDIFADLTMKIVQGIMKYVAPIGLLAYFAALIADLGPQLLGSYARVTLLIYYPLGIVYFFAANFLFTYIAGKMPAVKAFFSKIFPVAITAFGTQSSIAAMPGNLEAAQETTAVLEGDHYVLNGTKGFTEGYPQRCDPARSNRAHGRRSHEQYSEDRNDVCHYRSAFYRNRKLGQFDFDLCSLRCCHICHPRRRYDRRSHHYGLLWLPDRTVPDHCISDVPGRSACHHEQLHGRLLCIHAGHPHC